MTDTIRVENEFYVLPPSAALDERPHVLKHGETFAIFDRFGDVHRHELGQQGIFHEGTRYLSRSLVLLGRERPLFLNSTVTSDNALLAVNLTNPDMLSEQGAVIVPRGTVHLLRAKFLWRGACYERLRVRNYGLGPVDLSLTMLLDADFADIFEVRGVSRARRGTRGAPVVDAQGVAFVYHGLDGLRRIARVTCRPAAERVAAGALRLRISLGPKDEIAYVVTLSCEAGRRPLRRPSYDAAAKTSTTALRRAQAQFTAVESSNERFDGWLLRSSADLRMMTTETVHGPYPYAGVPWFSAPFGRDGLITAFQCLWTNPELARGALQFLAAIQAVEVDPEHEAEPGKILHEARKGEMAALGEVPFGRYYGSADATPLFLMLAAAYFTRTGDRELIDRLWPNLERALAWIERYGDVDGDQFVEYQRHGASGLANQGWKDSHDAVFHADGELAEGPIALCEVQGYVFAALRGMADLAHVLGKPRRAALLYRQAEALQQRFERTFWSDELGMYALALDGRKRPCLVRSSNAGHCLWTGIVSPARALAVARHLMSEEFFSGWGIRTVGTSAARYNPMSYHNGSVWPHDNALIAAGLARYGFRDAVARILEGMFDTSLFVDVQRLPELFCGFSRRPGEGPTLYPVACSPQAWASGSAFMLLQMLLGLTIDAPQRRIRFLYPALPAGLRELHIRRLRVMDASADLLLESHGQDVGIKVSRRVGQLAVEVIK